MRFTIAAVAALLVAGCASRPKMKLVSPPDLFPVVQGDIALGKPGLEADDVALTIRLPVENRGAVPFDPATVKATLTDAKAREHAATVRGGIVEPGKTGEVVVEVEPKGVARGLADLSIAIGEGAAASLDFEIGRSESGNDRLERIGWTALGLAAVIVVLIVIGVASTEECVASGTLPGECHEDAQN